MAKAKTLSKKPTAKKKAQFDPDPEREKRFEWVMANRPPCASLKKWSLKAGLSQAMAGQIMNNRRKGKTSLATWKALADAADVSVEWLSAGIGSPEGDDYDPYPTRVGIEGELRRQGVSDRIIEDLRKIRFKSGDPGAEEWVRLAKELVNGAKSAKEAFGHEGPDERID